eukprot:TRINITY_DN11998_c0_g2_i2.p1 TRINITY_DN11998_c0_g2~~TRINITY_DN11998_c0_g2_i2.p1  ORF type:complete len:243 (+),score=49.22 TRINITY_DN11998_c0_g2_i2:934-1662(+)
MFVLTSFPSSHLPNYTVSSKEEENGVSALVVHRELSYVFLQMSSYDKVLRETTKILGTEFDVVAQIYRADAFYALQKFSDSYTCLKVALDFVGCVGLETDDSGSFVYKEEKILRSQHNQRLWEPSFRVQLKVAILKNLAHTCQHLYLADEALNYYNNALILDKGNEEVSFNKTLLLMKMNSMDAAFLFWINFRNLLTNNIFKIQTALTHLRKSMSDKSLPSSDFLKLDYLSYSYYLQKIKGN